MKILTRMFIRTNKQAWLLIVVAHINTNSFIGVNKLGVYYLTIHMAEKDKLYINSTNPKVSTIQYSCQQAF